LQWAKTSTRAATSAAGCELPPRWDCRRSCILGAPSQHLARVNEVFCANCFDVGQEFKAFRRVRAKQFLLPPRRITADSHWEAVQLDVDFFGDAKEGRGARARPVEAPHALLFRPQQCEELARFAARSAKPPLPRIMSDVIHGISLHRTILCLRQGVVGEAGLEQHVRWDHSCGISGHIPNSQQKGQTKLFENQILCSTLLPEGSILGKKRKNGEGKGLSLHWGTLFLGKGTYSMLYGN
jgi:hypothetical protein